MSKWKLIAILIFGRQFGGSADQYGEWAWIVELKNKKWIIEINKWPKEEPSE